MELVPSLLNTKSIAALSPVFKVTAKEVASVISTSLLVKTRVVESSPINVKVEMSISLATPDCLTKWVPVTVNIPVDAS